ncbi:Hint domain-containing protein [Parasulfitobacter algicola]|uniref:Hint domain-containing protein n=1 Tax=Parasulfitobacter algicola TaxID=2614809 RepID=A0ABX2IU41_9RHOB|nr:Hint domain-containing protein [Sulfitobacter algicola]NSX55835.1 Hint domain-containing protein [Sulfitobacter algicola]
MPTTVNDQSFGGNFDPGFPPTFPANVTVISITILDSNDDGLVTSGSGDQVNGSDVIAVYNGDTVTIGGIIITGATIYTADGGRYFTPTDGTILTDSTVTDTGFVTDNTQLTLPELQPPCFTEDTLITVTNGFKKLVQDLKVGDLVKTKDHGLQPIKWIGRKTVKGTGTFAPVVFEKGAVGNSRRLAVSPQHRMLISSWQCELHFGECEMLCAAIHLCDDFMVWRQECEEITYFHVLFDKHEIIYAEDAEAESFYPGEYICKADRETHIELYNLFPEIPFCLQDHYTISRPILTGHEASLINRNTMH